MSNAVVKNEQFKQGLVNKYEDKSIPRGAQSGGYNFLNLLDKIELTRGRFLLGTEILGSGEVTGLHVCEKVDGTKVLVKTYNTNLEYYDDATNTWIVMKNNLTNGIENSFSNYHSLAGAQMFLSNNKDGMIKVITANLTSPISLYDSARNFKGKIRIIDNRTILWGRDEDKTGFYESYIETGVVGVQYTAVAAEAIGMAGMMTYSGTLAFKAGNPKANCFGLSIKEAGGETFTDNYNGTLTGSAGGTGTINYATGAYSVTFNVVTVGAVTADYTWEDSTNLKGLADFTKSSPRQAGEGAILRQDVGGDHIQTVMKFGDDMFSIKRIRTYKVNLTNDDTNASNLVYRERAGVPNWLAACETEEGIFFLDDSTEDEPKLRIFKPAEQNALMIPVAATESVDLRGYLFDKCSMVAWGDYVVFTARSIGSTKNDTVFMFHRVYRSINRIKWPIYRLAVYNGSLIGGESISNNVYILFSGFDEDNFGYTAEWESSSDNLGNDTLKKVKRLRFEGHIGLDQKIYVYAKYDDGNYQLLVDEKHPEGAIDGRAAYVEKGRAVTIGSRTVGRLEVGGGGDGVTAYHYFTEFNINTTKFRRVKIKLRVTDENIGYASCSMYEFFDIRLKRFKLPSKYRG